MQSVQHQTRIARGVSESLALWLVDFGQCALRFSTEQIEQGDG
jgi:hypothetical protein